MTLDEYNHLAKLVLDGAFVVRFCGVQIVATGDNHLHYDRIRSMHYDGVDPHEIEIAMSFVSSFHNPRHRELLAREDERPVSCKRNPTGHRFAVLAGTSNEECQHCGYIRDRDHDSAPVQTDVEPSTAPSLFQSELQAKGYTGRMRD